MYSFLPCGGPESLSESLRDVPQHTTTLLPELATKKSSNSHYDCCFTGKTHCQLPQAYKQLQ